LHNPPGSARTVSLCGPTTCFRSYLCSFRIELPSQFRPVLLCPRSISNIKHCPIGRNSDERTPRAKALWSAYQRFPDHIGDAARWNPSSRNCGSTPCGDQDRNTQRSPLNSRLDAPVARLGAALPKHAVPSFCLIAPPLPSPAADRPSTFRANTALLSESTYLQINSQASVGTTAIKLTRHRPNSYCWAYPYLDGPASAHANDRQRVE
jgi:hypothetical protein